MVSSWIVIIIPFSFGNDSWSSIPIAFNQKSMLSQSPDAVNCILLAFTDVEIPGRTIEILTGQVDTLHDNGSVVLIEPLLTLPDYLHVACSLGFFENGQVAIQVMNVSPSPIMIIKGMRLGMTTAEHNTLLVSQQGSSTEELPSLADNAFAPVFDTITTPGLSSTEQGQLLELLADSVTFLHHHLDHKVAPQQSSIVYQLREPPFHNQCFMYQRH